MSSLEALGIETLLLDVTDEGSIKSARERASEMLGGKLDVLVNNAGRGKRRIPLVEGGAASLPF